ncbi:ketoacyl-ACP synthase III [Clostridiaceae bacterium AF29-16BH]|nr:ketoacyl-ACP synthase III [Clostridiaceae bacterium AF29-16BH]
MNTRITGTGYSLPAFRADNDYLATLVETSDEWITERTGIRARHLAGEETTVSMAAAAAEKALKRAGAEPSEVELLIVATISGDTVTPSTACRVQALIGADQAVAFDINAACSGFLYALHMADACVKSGMYKNALLIGAETLSKLVDWSDRGTCILFGDGAGAAFVEATEEAGILAHEVGSDGSRWEVLSCEGRPNGNPVCKAEGQEGFLQMNGQEVFKFAVRKVPQCIDAALEKAALKPEDVDLYLLHQANCRIIQSVAKRLGQPEEKFPMNLNECGNTSAASLPILMAQLDEQGKLNRGDTLVLSGFGAGLTWGACVIKW